jgi:hypothetical protein
VGFFTGVFNDLQRMMMALVLANILSFFVTLILIIGRRNGQIELNNTLRSKDIECIKTVL